jgi:hypothetical protein
MNLFLKDTSANSWFIFHNRWTPCTETTIPESCSSVTIYSRVLSCIKVLPNICVLQCPTPQAYDVILYNFSIAWCELFMYMPCHLSETEKNPHNWWWPWHNYHIAYIARRFLTFGNSALNIALLDLIVLDLHFYDGLNSRVQIGAPQYSSFD